VCGSQGIFSFRGVPESAPVSVPVSVPVFYSIKNFLKFLESSQICVIDSNA